MSHTTDFPINIGQHQEMALSPYLFALLGSMLVCLFRVSKFLVVMLKNITML
jgi:hypothetical protein